ncbi:neutral and basic amino acid transport protein rBAT-like [Dendronephthya gigantea]|uniref:neutral and basic amino acid transport protein rBAT-like n=1 Tax=Dendronephthya gigantea TaxID=151771 RepID=UPI00106D21E4|nr:neutral and basic amino acid transport protein rBAT-like [Dendronephthya gigantea]
MGEVEFNKEDDYKVKIVDGGDYKEPGGGIRKPSQEEIDEYKIHRVIVMVIFGLVVAILLLLIVILIATTEGCESVEEEKLPWYKSGVMYNIYPRSYKDSSGDGTGDFEGIIKKLDHLKDLGVNILYLSSIFKINTEVDYGYSVINFTDTNPAYGSIKDFEKLVDRAHDKGMKVIIEFIPCDTSIDNEWFEESSKGNNKRDWYIWKNESGLDERFWSNASSGLFYSHPKNYPQKANLNWDNDDVKREFKSVLRFWLDKKVDGFRVVSIQRLFGANQTENAWSKIHTVVQKWQNYTKMRNPNSILIGSSHPANLELYGTEDRPELDIVVNFELVADTAKNFYTAINFKKIMNEYIGNLSNGNWPSWALTSWVHGRVGSNIDSKLAKSLEALLVLLPGTPIVFYGDEIGMQNVNNGKNLKVDENKAPMQWEDTKNAGFTSNNSTWFGDVGNASYTNAKDDQLGIMKSLKDAIKLRMENASVLLDGPLVNFTIINQKNVLAYTFKDKLPRFAVAINFDPSEQVINLNELGIKDGSLKYHTADKKPGKIDMKELKVPGYALYVFEVTKKM